MDPAYEITSASSRGLRAWAHQEQRGGAKALAGESQPVGYKRLKGLRKRCRHTAGGDPGATDTTAKRPPSKKAVWSGGPPTSEDRMLFDTSPRSRALTITLGHLHAPQLGGNTRHRPTRLSTAPDSHSPGYSGAAPTSTSRFSRRGPRLTAQSPIRRDHDALAG